MLTTTERLLTSHEARPARRRAALVTIRRHGSDADAAALLPVFLADPAANGDLLPVLATHGDTAMAEPLLAACVEDGWLKPEMPEDVLQVVGCLGYEPATRLLWNHLSIDDYSTPVAACLGLTHLPCTELAGEIDAALREHHFKNLFPEYLPALAAKTGDPAWPARIYDWGSRGNGLNHPGASTDCNGGLLVGLALSGDTALFERALWNAHWECYSSATGTIRAAYGGTRVLGLDAARLYPAAVSDDGGVDSRANAVLVLANLLRMSLENPWLGLPGATPPRDAAADLYDLVFAGERPLDKVASEVVADGRAVGLTEFDFSPIQGLYDVVHKLRVTLEAAAVHEAERDELRSRR